MGVMCKSTSKKLKTVCPPGITSRQVGKINQNNNKQQKHTNKACGEDERLRKEKDENADTVESARKCV